MRLLKKRRFTATIWMDRPLSLSTTSDVRNNHRDIPRPAQALSLLTGCAKEDHNFIQNVEAGRMKGGYRVFFIWSCLEDFSQSLRRRVFLELLEGSDDYDVWLWVDGDEEFLADRDNGFLDRYYYKPSWCEAAAALRKRQQRKHTKTPRQAELCQIVQSAEPEMRVAVIPWLVKTSAAWKNASADTGTSDREIWDLYGLIEDWWFAHDMDVTRWLEDRSVNFDLGPFDSAMAAQNHDCHQSPRVYLGVVKGWLYMRSLLFPNKKYDDLYLSRACDSRPVTCYGCRTRTTSEYPFQSPTHGFPPPVLVVLRDLWDETIRNPMDLKEDQDRDFCKWISAHTDLMSQLDTVDEFLRKQPPSPPDVCYFPYVNTYHEHLRYTVARYTLDDWAQMAKSFAHCPQNKSDRQTTPLDLHAWFGAVVLEMITCGNSENPAKKFANMEMFEPLKGTSPAINSFLPSFLLGEYEPTQAAIAFKTAIRKSGHTCWNCFNTAANYYASAMTFLGREVEVVGIARWEDINDKGCCKPCALGWRLHHLKQFVVRDEHYSYSEFSSRLSLMLKSLDQYCSERGLSFAKIAQKAGVNFTNDSDEEEEEDSNNQSSQASNPDIVERPVLQPVQSSTLHDSLDLPSVDQLSRYVLGNPLIEDRPALPADSSITSSTTIAHSASYIVPSFPGYETSRMTQSHTMSVDPAVYIQDANALALQYSTPTSTQYNYPQVAHNATGYTMTTQPHEEPSLRHLSSYLTMTKPLPRYAQTAPVVSGSQEHQDRELRARNRRRSSYLPMEEPFSSHPSSTLEAANSSTERHVDPNLPEAESTTSNILELRQQAHGHVASDFHSREPGPSKSTQFSTSNVRAVALQSKTRDEMIESIKTYLITAMDDNGVWLPTKNGKKQFPWLTFQNTLNKYGVEMLNWPKGVPLPGKGRCSSKGINGLSVEQLERIYEATRKKTNRLDFRRISPSEGREGQEEDFFQMAVDWDRPLYRISPQVPEILHSESTLTRKRGCEEEDGNDGRPRKPMKFINTLF